MAEEKTFDISGDPGTMLEAVNKAIYGVLLGGQIVKLGSRQVTRADLSYLQRMKAELEAQLSQNRAPGLLDSTFVAVFGGR